MYTYIRSFFGIPLSQAEEDLDDDGENFKMMLEGLTEFDSLDQVFNLDTNEYLSDFDSSEETKETFIMFINWIKENQAALKTLDFGFHRNYNGAGDDPLIFGVYGGIPLPKFGCVRIHPTRIADSIEKEKIVKALFSTMPKDVIYLYPPMGLAGLWVNSHSS